ncbi:MAG TPA: thiamine pyrophosphate-dependent enzyme [Rhizomicrobium sp.]|jgi:acetolactate synthase-1/2/3 large subunit|nr:thiamine pyrophosphate-dependent enzyme [Rhizomicrobium sp.]
MSKNDRGETIGRRHFLKGATIAGAALGAPPPAAAQSSASAAPVRSAPLPDMAAETLPPAPDPVQQTSSGGDFMVDVLKMLGVEYVTQTPANTFRGLHEAIINHGGNKAPELLSCTHEEIAVAMAHGYVKIEGKPLAVMAQSTVGLQHAAMALYNAYCDQAPVYMIVGNSVDASKRLFSFEWDHAAIDPAVIVRDYVKWDDQPGSLQHFAESAMRAWKIAMTPPMGPVLLSLDSEMQENPIPPRPALSVPPLTRVAPPQGDSAAVAETASLLVKAENPVIIADRLARTQNGMDRLVELAETLQCPVIDEGGRSNFPTRHPLNHSGRSGAVLAQADVILALELNDLYGTTHMLSDRIERRTRSIIKPGVHTISITASDLAGGANDQQFQRFEAVDLAIAADGEETLPALIEQVKRLADADRKTAFDARRKRLESSYHAMVEQWKADATIGWDASPVTLARLCAELYDQIRNDDWSMVGNGIRVTWPRRLWNFDKTYRWIGSSGGAGVGYNAPASLGAALANRKYGRLSVSIQGDGDLMFCPGTLWTAAHHQIPILYVMHNNRAWHQELMYVQAMSNRHGRGVENAHIGTTITDPNIDFAMMAKSMGVYAEGPINNPKDLAPALKRALAVVRKGQPALVDVITDPR